MDIHTFIFVDCETTGLPYQEYNRTRVTELSMVAVDSAHIGLGVFPRVLSKLNFCFNPRKMISPIASELTGLTNDLLECQPAFSADTVMLINGFLEQYKKPICLVAHNGYVFDYPIIRAEVERTGSALDDDLLCCDTMQIFRALHKQEQQPPAAKLPSAFRDNFDGILVAVFDELERSEKVAIAQNRNETTPKKVVLKVVAGDAPSPSGLYYLPEGLAFSQSYTDSYVPEAKKQLKFGCPSFKLSDVYTRLTKKNPIDAHRAEVDVNMLIDCAAVLGSEFVISANNNCKKLSDIPIMRPGKKIGT